MPLEDANISELLEGFLDRQREEHEKTLAQFRQEIDDLLRDHDLSDPARKSIGALADRLQTVETQVNEHYKWTQASIVLLIILFKHTHRGNADIIDGYLHGSSNPQVKAFMETIGKSLRQQAASSSARQWGSS